MKEATHFQPFLLFSMQAIKTCLQIQASVQCISKHQSYLFRIVILHIPLLTVFNVNISFGDLTCV